MSGLSLSRVLLTNVSALSRTVLCGGLLVTLLLALPARTQGLGFAAGAGGTEDDLGLGVAVYASGNVYTTGYFRQTADFDPGAGTEEHTSAGENDIFVQKLDANGAFGTRWISTPARVRRI